jgi:2'-phosphotransferase
MPRNRTPMSLEEKISRRLTKVLRHEAPKRGIPYDKHGGVEKDMILSEFDEPGVDWSFIQRIVETNSKKRFAIYHDEEDAERICALQGHSFSVILFSSETITKDNYSELGINLDMIVHGTYYEYLKSIVTLGLSRMSRTHIHFGVNVPESGEVLSGMRKSCEVMIFIDILGAIEDGYTFTLSNNKVILTTGNSDGFLPSKYFTYIVDRKSGNQLPAIN